MWKISRYNFECNLLIVYIYILLFGGWILKKVGIPDGIALLFLSAIDVLPLVVWFLSNPSFRIKTKDIFINTLFFWILWLVLLLLVLYASYRCGGSMVPSFIHWGALVRYIPLSYAIISLDKYVDVNNRILKQFRIIAIILLISGYLCILLGEKAVFFLPVMSESATGLRETLAGNYSVFFANTIEYSFILLLFYTITIYRLNISIIHCLILTLLFFFPIFKSGSAISTLIFCIIFFFRLTAINLKVRYMTLFFLISIVFILSYKYWDLVMLVVDNAKLSRLGMLMVTGPDFLTEMSVDTFWGIGNDGYVVLNKVNGYKEQVHMLFYAKDGDISAFGDVYWIALLVFHGLIGLSLILYIYYNLFKSTTNKIYVDNKLDYDAIIKCFFFIIVILAFFNQILSVKTFALVFWIFLAIAYNKIQRNENFTNK